MPRTIYITTREVYLWSVATTLLSFAFFAAPYYVTHDLRAMRLTLVQTAVALLLLPVHEFIHLASYRVAGAARRDVALRFSWRALLPYAELKVALEVVGFRWAVVLPGLLTGVVPALVGLALGSGRCVLVGTLMTAAAGGDIAVLHRTRGIPSGTLVMVKGEWARGDAGQPKR